MAGMPEADCGATRQRLGYLRLQKLGGGRRRPRPVPWRRPGLHGLRDYRAIKGAKLKGPDSINGRDA